MEQQNNEEKTLTLKGLEKSIKEKFNEMDNELAKLQKEIEIIKKVLKK